MSVERAAIAVPAGRAASLSNFAIASIVMAAVLLLHGGILAGLARLWWESATYSQGFLVVPAAAYVWFRARATVNGASVAPQPLALVALVMLCAVILLCELALLQAGAAALLPLTMLTGVYAAFGWQVARSALLPMLLLYCVIPVWSVITPYLQLISATASAGVASLLGVLLVRTGTTIEIGSGAFEVAPGCSGTNFFLCSLSVALILGEMHSLRLRGRLVLIASALVVSMVANWFRIITLVVLGDITKMQHYLVADEHYTFGWIAFAIALFAWIYVAGRVIDRVRPAAVVPRSAVPERDAPPRGSAGIAVAAVAIASTGAAWALVAANPSPAQAPRAAEVLPLVPGWAGPSDAVHLLRPEFPGVDEQWQATYRRDGAEIFVYRNAYLTEEPGRELVSSRNRLAPEAWRLMPTDQAGGAIATAPSGEKWLIQSWMLVGETIARRPLEAKLVQALYRLRWQDVPSGVAVVAARCDVTCEAAEGTVAEFLADAGFPARSGFRTQQHALAADSAAGALE